jgi:toxin ParE1/3/4
MSDTYEIVASPVFNLTLKKLFTFLSNKHGNDIATNAIAEIKLKVGLLVEHPYLAPVSDRLEALGFSDYRQLSIDKHNIVYYRIDTSRNKIILIVAMDSRQSIEQLLYEVTIGF